MPYDRDGSEIHYWVGGITATGAITTISQVQRAQWNDESTSIPVNFGGTAYGVVIIFPELRDIDGFYLNAQNSYGNTMQTSIDTTNGQDGTWVTRLLSFSVFDGGSTGYYRTGINGLSAAGIRAMRFNAAYNQYTWHIYGKVASGVNPDRMIFWHPVLDQELAANALDPGNAGDVARGQTYDRTFRIKNNSATKTATNLTVSVEALTDNSPSVVAMCTLSYGGGAFGSSITIPTLAPGVVSPVITTRLAVSSTAATLTCSPRINAIPQTLA